jgi:hypothetical protein
MEGTRLVCYLPAVTASSTTVTLNLVFEIFPDAAFQEIGGRTGQEAAFPGLVPIGSWPAIAAADADRLILRLVEIQYRDGTDLSNIDDKSFTPSENGFPRMHTPASFELAPNSEWKSDRLGSAIKRCCSSN